MTDSPDFDGDLLEAIFTNRPAALARHCKDPEVAALLETMTFDMDKGPWTKVRARVAALCMRLIDKADDATIESQIARAFYQRQPFGTTRKIVDGQLPAPLLKRAGDIAFLLIKRMSRILDVSPPADDR